MSKFLTVIILISLSIAGFFMLTKPLYNDVLALRTEVASYDQALTNAKALEAEKDKLMEKYKNISPENLTKLQKMLPDNVDNIRLILEIGKIALPYGMILKDVKYDTFNSKPDANTVNGAMPAGDGSITTLKDYGSWDLEFATAATYNNFVAFLKDLESNLRIIDIASIDFSSDTGVVHSGPNQVYNYGFKIKTYWLKN